MRSVKIVIISISLCFSGILNAQQYSKAEQAIMANFDQQVKCWNQGDIECYCQGYLKSDETRIVSSRGITSGYEAIVASYKKNWPKERMGQLHFDQVKMDKLSNKVYLVHGRFNLTFRSLGTESKPLSGYFTVIMKKVKGQWLMFADHSS